MLNTMDALKAARRQHRRIFTKACNEFDASESNLSAAEKILKLTMIEEKAKFMTDVEYKIREILYSDQADEETIDKDIDESEVYIDRWRVLQQKLNELLVVKNEDLKSDISVINKDVLLHYPKIQLPTFNGEIRNWLQFWGQFQKIDQDTSLDFHDKFAYLSQAMEKGSVAEEMIRSFPPGGNSYAKAVSQLKSRFGRKELLIEYYVRDLLGLVLQKQNPGKHNSLRRLYDSLESKLRSLETLGVIRDKYAAMLYPLVESSLPDDILRAWERYRTSHRRSSNRCNDVESELDKNHDTDLNNGVLIGSKTDLDNLLEFLQDEVEAEERISLASKSFDKTFRYTQAARNNHEIEESQISAVSDLLNIDMRKYTRNKNNFKQKLCIFCDKRHASKKCFKAMSMSYDVKKDIMQKKGTCFLCLKLNHLARNCRAKVKCIVCRKKHETLVCPRVPERLIKPEEAQDALKALNNYYFRGSSLSVEPSKSKLHHEPVSEGGATGGSSRGRGGYGGPRGGYGYANGYGRRYDSPPFGSRDFYDRGYSSMSPRMRPYPSPYDRRSPSIAPMRDKHADPYSSSLRDPYSQRSGMSPVSRDLYERSSKATFL